MNFQRKAWKKNPHETKHSDSETAARYTGALRTEVTKVGQKDTIHKLLTTKSGQG